MFGRTLKVEEMPKFTFVDLFAGIGGFRLAAESLGGKCVYSSEIDKYCHKTYLENFGELPNNFDIRELNPKDMPNFDLLCAGFPCQAFSIAGKKLGFDDSRGTLFYDLVRIIKEKRPKAFILENVKGLVSHKGGKTLKTILNVLRNDFDLNYNVVEPEILNAKDFGVPQNRPRVFIVGFESTDFPFKYPLPFSNLTPKLKDILESYFVGLKYYLNNNYWESLKIHKERHHTKGNGFGYVVLNADNVSNAIIVGGQGRERNLIQDSRFISEGNYPRTKNSEFIRTFTPRECARLQGFPEYFQIPVSDTQAYKQFGNSVAIPVVQAVLQAVLHHIC